MTSPPVSRCLRRLCQAGQHTIILVVLLLVLVMPDLKGMALLNAEMGTIQTSMAEGAHLKANRINIRTSQIWRLCTTNRRTQRCTTKLRSSSITVPLNNPLTMHLPATISMNRILPLTRKLMDLALNNRMHQWTPMRSELLPPSKL